jgi:hypothetical protein
MSVDKMEKVFKKPLHFVFPAGKPMITYLYRCQGFGVNGYDFTIARLEPEASLDFSQLGC